MSKRFPILAICVFLLSCSSSRSPRPLPPIRHASPEIAKLRIAVHNASHDAARVDGESTVTGYTIMVREAVQRSLVRAGFVLVNHRAGPFDLLARITVQSPSLHNPGTASLSLLTPNGIVVDQFSSLVEIDDHVDILESGPVSLVEQLSASPRISAFAKAHPRPLCELETRPIPVLAVPETNE